jgi:protein-arginine kinase activator protein McsA
MLQKLDTPYIHKLRIIQLFEGDFNRALKYLLGRLLMYHVVKQRQCDKQAFGSIPGHTAHDALITLQLKYDNTRLNKSVLASMFNDAAGCYDRIRPLLSSICMQ